MLHVSYADAELPAWGCTYCGEDNLGIETFCDNCHEYNDVVLLLGYVSGYVSGRTQYTHAIRGLGFNLSSELLGRSGWSVRVGAASEVLQFDYRPTRGPLTRGPPTRGPIFCSFVATKKELNLDEDIVFRRMMEAEAKVRHYRGL